MVVQTMGKFVHYVRVVLDIVLLTSNDPTRTGSPSVTLADNTASFDRDYINEAPAVIINKKTVNLVYSSNNWKTRYTNALMTMNLNSDPLKRASWSKPVQVFRSTQQCPNAGSGNFITSAQDGRVYWAFNYISGAQLQRTMVLNQVLFDANGVVLLGSPTL